MATARKSEAGRRVAMPGRLGAAIRRRPDLAGLGLVLLALAVQTFLKSGSEWVEVYVAAGRRLIGGQPVYLPGGNYVYPPFTAMVAAPIAFVGPTAARAVWFVASAASLILLLRGCWLLSGSPDPAGIRSWSRMELLAAVLGVACGATYLLNAFAHQQIDVIIAALLIGGCLQLARGRDLGAGVLIGIAAACKATPLIWLPYLVWRRRWIAAAASGLVALGLNLAPDLVGSREAEPEPRLVTWFSQVVLPTQEPNGPLGTWYSALIYNQSLAGTLERLANTRLEFDANGPRALEARSVPTAILKSGCYLLFALLLAISALAAGARGRVGSSLGEGSAPDRVALEYSALLALMLLLSPMSSPAHFGVLLLPGLCLARLATVVRRSGFLWALVGVSGVVAIAMNGDLAGRVLRSVMLWGGTLTVVTLLLWAGCVAVLLQTRSRPAAPRPAGERGNP